jgi:hypothetical protein
VKLLIMSFDTAQQLETTGEVDDDDLLELKVAAYSKHTLTHYYSIFIISKHILPVETFLSPPPPSHLP